jgi:histidinol-phosphate phosphatase family protein
LAGLSSVDFVFVFDEQNNNSNISALKPDFYVKAADYSKTNLSSAPLVESYGGRVELIPLVAGKSSTTLIETAAERLLYGCIELPKTTSKPVAFLDRDGTLNESVEYLGEPEKMKLLPGVVEGLKQLNELGYLTVLVTNQPGIGMGYFSREDFYRVNRVLLKAASAGGAKIHKIYFCPHSHAEECSCRKPKTGMIDLAFAELSIDKSRSVVIGDTTLDIKLAENAGLQSILVQTGMGGKDGNFSCNPTHVAQDFRAAVEILASKK